MFVLLPINASYFVCYVAAARLLRSALGAKAPSAVHLVEMELSNRRARTIAEEFMDFHGYPSLRVCRRKMAASRRLTSKVKSFRAVIGSRAAQRPKAQGDPGRN